MSASWVAPIEVIDALARCHEQSGRFADLEVCIRVAEDAVLDRLVAGQLRAMSSFCENYRVADKAPKEWRDAEVPTVFWNGWLNAGPLARNAEWLMGDFSYGYFVNGQHKWDWDQGRAFGVRLDASAFPGLEISSRQVEPSPVLSGTGRGRKPANWWPDFAEELAMFVLMNDLPDSQSDMIDAIFSRMSEDGKVEPSRTTVQPVISNVFRRFNSAEK